jgi:uncharacterized membrane protein YbaN (DUF454 family)
LNRTAYRILGHLCVALGLIGAFLPVMPTVVFLVGASACYARGSPALRRKLLAHPQFGPPIRDWEQHRAISVKGKVLGIATLTVGIAASMLWGVKADWLRVVLLVIWAGIVVFMLSVKTSR